MKILVTGGAGFIGSALVRQLVKTGTSVVNLDLLTYAANLANLNEVAHAPHYVFEHADIRDCKALRRIFDKYAPDAVIHLAAETHVDRSIDGPAAFVETNIVGTYHMLEAAAQYWRGLSTGKRDAFRFIHVSTDEVYGSLDDTGAFTEETPYKPNSPYSASKAASDHLVRAWHETYGLPVIVTNCTNNFGPFQHPEKLIPLMIIKALSGEPLPVYGKGENVRDWLYVEDHACALRMVLEKGIPGRTYNIGGNCEVTNIEIVRSICSVLDRLAPKSDGHPHKNNIRFVADRPGHDFRYAMDTSRITSELGWSPSGSFKELLEATIVWYLGNKQVWHPIVEASNATLRIGLGR